MPKRKSDVLHIIGVIVVIWMAGALIWMAVREQKLRSACREDGGRVEEYNCYTTTTCTTTNHGNTSTTRCTPHTTCQWRCVFPAEKENQ